MSDFDHSNEFSPYQCQVVDGFKTVEFTTPVRRDRKSNADAYARAIKMPYARITALPVRYIAETNPTASWVDILRKEAHATEKSHESRTFRTGFRRQNAKRLLFQVNIW